MSTPATPRRDRGRFVPRLELLEDRLTPSTAPLSHDDWARQRFTVGAEAGPAPVVAAASPEHKLIRADQAQAQYPYRGSGYSVAVIDTGIDYRHPALGGGWGRRVVGGWDFVNNDADPLDDNGHGTHVAGIIGSSDANYRGVAPDVNLIALKALDAGGSGSFGDVEDALQWVVAHQAQYRIAAVNLSLGAGNFASNPFSFLEDEFAALVSRGVFIAAAAGNNFYGYGSQQGLGYPAVSSQVVSVGAVWGADFGPASWANGGRDWTTGADRVASFTQRSAGLDLLAPGAYLTNTYVGGGFATLAGTSMAAPVVAGAAAVLRQALDTTGQGHLASQSYLLGLMQSTGAAVKDGDDENDNVINSGLTFRRLDLLAALRAVAPPPQPAAPPAGDAPASQPPPRPAARRPAASGVYDPTTATWYVSGPAPARFAFGAPGWLPVVGDWDGDGSATVGAFDPSIATFYLRNSNSAGGPDAGAFRFGVPGWVPVVGDWDGDGRTSVGLFDPATATFYLRNSNAFGAPDVAPFRFGAAGWMPVAGDWDGDGRTSVGVFDPRSATWYLRNSNSTGGADVTPFAYGAPGWVPLAGDWDGDGRTDSGVFDPRSATWYQRRQGSGGTAAYAYGAAGWSPFAGGGAAVTGRAASMSDPESAPPDPARLNALGAAFVGDPRLWAEPW